MAIRIFGGKHIVLGVTGSIAAYKVADLASKLTQAGALVDVILTEAAQEFITPMTFQALTGRPVYTDLWTSPAAASALPTHIAHVGLGEGADLLAIIPATANTLAKLAAGLSDDLISVTALAARCPLVVAPAMDGGMYEHPATQANLATLQGRGAYVIVPEEGRFASGLIGRGRLPETPALMGHLRHQLSRKGPLVGRRVLVTAGGTRESIDPVRYLSNHSSGKQGYAIAQAALDAGAEVVLVSTVAAHTPPPFGAEVVAVDSAAEMRDAVLDRVNTCDVLVMAAAVADFRPASFAVEKIKKHQATLSIPLAKNDDILQLVGEQRARTGHPQVSVGFAAETQDLLDYARDKLERKNLDLIVANDLTQAGAGFAGDTNIVTLLHRRNPSQPETLELMSKTAVAEALIERIAALL
jgi:phosphopantothenoylcysteine decarboxylase/phosphopantothenate--cysteine ligase